MFSGSVMSAGQHNLILSYVLWNTFLQICLGAIRVCVFIPQLYSMWKIPATSGYIFMSFQSVLSQRGIKWIGITSRETTLSKHQKHQNSRNISVTINWGWLRSGHRTSVLNHQDCVDQRFQSLWKRLQLIQLGRRLIPSWLVRTDSSGRRCGWMTQPVTSFCMNCGRLTFLCTRTPSFVLCDKDLNKAGLSVATTHQDLLVSRWNRITCPPRPAGRLVVFCSINSATASKLLFLFLSPYGVDYKMRSAGTTASV